MKKLLAFLIPCSLAAQPGNYWQQEVNYTMNIDLDVKKHTFTGEQTLVYTNNSPDTIHEVFYHLYFNAFQPGSMMDERSRSIEDPDKRVMDRISKLKAKEQGYHHITSLTQDGERLNYVSEQTILKALLRKPLLPGESTTLKMTFDSQVPEQIRRSGRDNAEGVDYTMTQWYPKLAEYDENGWHPDPYVGREFYAPFGTFDVSITLDRDYKIGGTGELQDYNDYWRPESSAIGKNHTTNWLYLKGEEKTRTWRFVAKNVHDFAFAADPNFIHLSNTAPTGTALNYFYLPKYKDTWEELPIKTQEFFGHMNRLFGKYQYPQFSVIQGGDGGMEYPMCTMLKGTGKIEGLVGVMVHEAAHNWFYGMLATNETQYPWMDEGFTSYAEEEVLNLMSENPVANPHERAYRNFAFLVQKGEIEPLATPGDYFSKNRTYSISAYSRGEIFLNQLKYIVGEKTFKKGMLRYFDVWKLKHPDPWDFIKVMEKESGMQLDWYLNFWLNTNKYTDYAIEEVVPMGKGMGQIHLKRIGEMPMPVEVTIETQSGQIKTYHIPVYSAFGAKNDDKVSVVNPAWAWTNETYILPVEEDLSTVTKITLDAGHFVADVDRTNDVWERGKEKE